MTKLHNGTRPKLYNDESGIASFLVTLVLMIVITLIVVGFAQIARRDQRESLDDQLSTQAFYAAETGVNLVQDLMKTIPAGDLTKTTCANTVAPYTSAQLTNAKTQVSNSCLLVDSAPTSLVYSDIGSNSTVVPLKPDVMNSYGTGTLKITWLAKTPAASDNMAACSAIGSYGTFPVNGSVNWPPSCPVGVLRFDLVNVSAAGVLDSQSLQNQTMTVFAPPSTSSHAPIVKRESASVGFNPGNVSCSSVANTCSLQINNVNFNGINYMRLTSLYKDVAVSSISGVGSAGQPVHFVGAQIAVDSTGKAVDVLRRIQVRLSQNNQLAPASAIQSTNDICKLYTTDGVTTTNGCGSPTGGGGAGIADFTECPGNSSCPPPSGGGVPTISWWASFVNTSNNSPSDIISCSWNFDDGPEGNPNPIVQNQDCNYGDSIQHTFYPQDLTPPFTCHTYNVVLKIYLRSNPTTPVQKTDTIVQPHGSATSC